MLRRIEIFSGIIYVEERGSELETQLKLIFSKLILQKSIFSSRKLHFPEFKIPYQNDKNKERPNYLKNRPNWMPNPYQEIFPYQQSQFHLSLSSSYTFRYLSIFIE